jgi:hypothetical protein
MSKPVYDINSIKTNSISLERMKPRILPPDMGRLYMERPQTYCGGTLICPPDQKGVECGTPNARCVLKSTMEPRIFPQDISLERMKPRIFPQDISLERMKPRIFPPDTERLHMERPQTYCDGGTLICPPDQIGVGCGTPNPRCVLKSTMEPRIHIPPTPIPKKSSWWPFGGKRKGTKKHKKMRKHKKSRKLNRRH